SIVLSCSKEYAPPELRKGKREKIGIWSDFYEIGCVVFEMLFKRLPKSIEISGCKLKLNTCELLNDMNPEFFSALHDFFRHTITVNHKNRYQTDEELIKALKYLYKLSEKHEKYIVSNFTAPSAYFTGRKEEMHHIEKLIIKENHVIIQGVGGIGKSSLALQYADKYRNNYHTIVYLEYTGSFDNLIKYDIKISGIPDNLSVQEKYDIFRNLCDSGTLVILDNLSFIDYEIIQKNWISLPCHVIITSRVSDSKFEYCTISLNGLQEAVSLFHYYYQKPSCTDEENQMICNLIYTIDSHTMMTELLGKLCGINNTSRYIPDLKEVYEAFRKSSMKQVSTEKVSQLKDWTPSNKSIQEHMDILFSIFEFSPEEQHILQFFALLPLKTIARDVFSKWCPYYQKNYINALTQSGMIQSDINGNYKMHPLILDRVLYHYPPQASEFALMSETMVDSLLASTSTNRNLLRYMSEHYTSNLHGIHESLAFLYQIMSCYFKKDKSKFYLCKSKEMYSELLYKSLPVFFELYNIKKEYSNLSWFYDDETEEKKSLIEKFISVCDIALGNQPKYKPFQKYEQISKICRELFYEDIACFGSEKQKFFCIYYAKFLEKALKYCKESNDMKRIATALYQCYSDFVSPIENAVKAEKYRIMADSGIKFYNAETNERIENTEQSQVANMIEAMHMEKDTDTYVALADEWFYKYTHDNIDSYDAYLTLLIENIYEETEQWAKYKKITEIKMKYEQSWDTDYSLELGKAYYHLNNQEKAKEYLLKSIAGFDNIPNKSLDYESEKYLIAYSLLIKNSTSAEERLNYETEFFSVCNSYLEYSLLKKSDDIAKICLDLSSWYHENFSKEIALEYLIFYARFCDIFYI
ncbi:MAG: hypothetical protein K2G88_01150, partial [Oscillospiraceae bacterium]|nr:hypothetical protein [Oscillospiraceae bacterium]